MPQRPRLIPIRRIDEAEDAVVLEAAVATAVADPLLAQHQVEQEVWRELHSTPGIHFSSLIVRRTRDGLCLQGVMETEADDSTPDVDKLVRQVARVQSVVNQLLVRERSAIRQLPR